MSFLQGKRALVTGIASTRSIAYGIAQALYREGATLALTYQNDKLKSRVEQAAADFGQALVFPCDVDEDRQIEQLFSQMAQQWDGLDIIIHSIAFAPREALQGDYVSSVSRDSFRIAHETSSYSFTALAKAARPFMQGRPGALLTLSYLGAERAMGNYNVMGLAKASLEANVRYMAQALGAEGIRVNAISAGPIKTLAAAGIGDFRKILDHVAQQAPLRRNVTIEEVGNVAAFLCSDLASGVTGEVVYVDAGYHIAGMRAVEANA